MFYFNFNNRLSVVFDDNTSFTCSKEDSVYPLAMKLALEEDWDNLKILINSTKQIMTTKDYNLKDSTINGVKVESPLTHLINRIKEKGVCEESIEHIKPFLENCLENQYIDAVEEIYDFIKKLDLVITKDGCFLAYKHVNSNLTSCHDGKTLHTPGTWVEVEDFDTNRNNVCSQGLHFCSRDYLDHYPGDVTICVKVNPKDVVSIPTDYNFEKGRCKKYFVVGIMPTNKLLTDEEVLERFGLELAEEKKEEEKPDNFFDAFVNLFTLKEEKEDKLPDDLPKHLKEIMIAVFSLPDLEAVADKFNVKEDTIKRRIREYNKFMKEHK